MEPRHYKLLAEILMVAGIILAVIGLAVVYGLHENMTGAIIMIAGSGMLLISLPTFMILTALSTFNAKK
jgi:hypothetical protein